MHHGATTLSTDPPRLLQGDNQNRECILPGKRVIGQLGGLTNHKSTNPKVCEICVQMRMCGCCLARSRFRANSAHVRQSGPDYGQGFQVHLVEMLPLRSAAKGEPAQVHASGASRAGVRVYGAGASVPGSGFEWGGGSLRGSKGISLSLSLPVCLY